MREIKFRAWSKEGLRFWYFDYMSGFNAENNDCFTHPMQFTGLKDKNGVDIYEGDIILTYWRTVPKNYKVYCNEETQSWDIVSVDEDENLQGLFDYHFDCQVIGNIHQKTNL